MKILIAEDNFACRGVLASILKKSEHEVVSTKNGSEAWEALQQPDPPKLLILDWMMPEMDGPEVLRRVREQNTDRPPYIIMLTSKGEKDHIIAGLSAGANDYLTKPFDPDELLVRLEVGERMVEMQLRQHHQRVNSQRFRVEAEQRLTELQDTLTAKSDDLRRTQADLQTLGARLFTMREERTAISRELQDSFARQLTSLRESLIEMVRQLRAGKNPEQEELSHQLIPMVHTVESLLEQTGQTCASLLTGV